MPRDVRAYLSDIIDACEAIGTALGGVDLATYQSERLIRSAVEREFITIGEAVISLRRADPSAAASLSHDRMIVGFRNVLVHDYASIDDETVLAIAANEVPILKSECEAVMQRIGADD